MARPLTPKARQFYERYLERYNALEEAATVLEAAVRSALGPHNFDLHLVAARAKDPGSLLKKIRAKGYGDPARQLTDQVAARVITYYETDVDKVVSVLRQAFEVDEKRSEDKRVALGLTKFGYRSVHLVVRLPSARADTQLRRRWCEIQVRSLLEHAWAEIEHELVYKAGIVYPDGVLRQFAALAGAAEVLDQQFLLLRHERAALIDAYRTIYGAGDEFDETLDAARLLGLLEVIRPVGRSWRRAEEEGSPFPPRIEATCVEALTACDLTTARALSDALGAREYLAAEGDFASLSGLGRDEISHLATVVLLVASRDRAIFDQEFLEMQEIVETYVPSLATAA
jgi:ppGpp synthetase/RelA/SpoT-type nucleotidyltranferase